MPSHQALADSEKSNFKSSNPGSKDSLNQEMLDLMIRTQEQMEIRMSVEGALYNQISGEPRPEYYMWRASDGSNGRQVPPDFTRTKMHIPHFLPPEKLQSELGKLNDEGLKSVYSNLVARALVNSRLSNQKLIELLNGQYTLGRTADDNSHLQVLCTYLSSFLGANANLQSMSSSDRDSLRSAMQRTQFLVNAGYITSQNPVMCSTKLYGDAQDQIDLQQLLEQRRQELQRIAAENPPNRITSQIPPVAVSPGNEPSRCSISQINKFVNSQRRRLEEAHTNSRIFFAFKDGNCHLNGELSKTAQNKIRLFVRPYYPGESSHTFVVDKIEELSSKIMSFQFPEFVAEARPATPAAPNPARGDAPNNQSNGPRCVGCNPFGSVR